MFLLCLIYLNFLVKLGLGANPSETSITPNQQCPPCEIPQWCHNINQTYQLLNASYTKCKESLEMCENRTLYKNFQYLSEKVYNVTNVVKIYNLFLSLSWIFTLEVFLKVFEIKKKVKVIIKNEKWSIVITYVPPLVIGILILILIFFY